VYAFPSPERIKISNYMEFPKDIIIASPGKAETGQILNDYKNEWKSTVVTVDEILKTLK
jgi:hypothetical protein